MLMSCEGAEFRKVTIVPPNTLSPLWPCARPGEPLWSIPSSGLVYPPVENISSRSWHTSKHVKRPVPTSRSHVDRYYLHAHLPLGWWPATRNADNQ